MFSEQLPGVNSSPIVTKLRQSYPWPQGTRWLNFGRLRSKVKVDGEACALLNAILVALYCHQIRWGQTKITKTHALVWAMF